jgi:hypothetical protein
VADEGFRDKRGISDFDVLQLGAISAMGNVQSWDFRYADSFIIEFFFRLATGDG